MPEYRSTYTLSIDVDIYFTAVDEDAADEITDLLAEAAVLALQEPTPELIAQVDESTRGTILDVVYNGPEGSFRNDGPYEAD